MSNDHLSQLRKLEFNEVYVNNRLLRQLRNQSLRISLHPAWTIAIRPFQEPPVVLGVAVHLIPSAKIEFESDAPKTDLQYIWYEFTQDISQLQAIIKLRARNFYLEHVARWNSIQFSYYPKIISSEYSDIIMIEMALREELNNAITNLKSSIVHSKTN